MPCQAHSTLVAQVLQVMASHLGVRRARSLPHTWLTPTHKTSDPACTLLAPTSFAPTLCYAHTPLCPCTLQAMPILLCALAPYKLCNGELGLVSLEPPRSLDAGVEPSDLTPAQQRTSAARTSAQATAAFGLRGDVDCHLVCRYLRVMSAAFLARRLQAFRRPTSRLQQAVPAWSTPRSRRRAGFCTRTGAA